MIEITRTLPSGEEQPLDEKLLTEFVRKTIYRTLKDLRTLAVPQRLWEVNRVNGDGMDYIEIAAPTYVPAGMHTINVSKENEKPFASKIVNIPANQPVMRLGIQEQKEAIDWAQMAIIIITILAMVAVAIIYYRKYLFKILQRLVRKV